MATGSCSECGAAIADENYCPDCGAEIHASDGDTAPVESAESSGFSVKMAITAGVLGLLIGGFAAWGTANMGGVAGVAFLVGLVGGSYYLYQKPIPSKAIGSGLYIIALEMLLLPIAFYIPMMVGADTDTARGAGEAIGSTIGIVVWGIVFFILAIVTAAIGYFANKRAAKKLSRS